MKRIMVFLTTGLCVLALALRVGGDEPGGRQVDDLRLLNAENRLLKSTNKALRAEVAKLKAENVRLRALLRRTSVNSDKHPASPAKQSTQQPKRVLKVYFDIPKLLTMNIVKIKAFLGAPQNEFIPTENQLKLDIPFTVEYVKGSVRIHIDYLKTGAVKSIFISDKTKGSSEQNIMKLGNLDKQNSKYRIRIQNWLSPARARANGEAEIAGIEVTPLR